MRLQSADSAGSEPGKPVRSDAEDLAALLTEAQNRLSDSDAPGARTALEKARARVQRMSDRAAEADGLQAIGALDAKLGNHAGALQGYERAQAIWQELGDAARAARAWLAVGDARRALGRLPKAIEAYRAATNGCTALDDLLGQAHAAFKLAQLASTRSPEPAAQEFTRAAALYSEADQRRAGGGLRIANPHLPDRVDDLDAIEPWIMAKVAEREAARLREAPDGAVLQKRPDKQAPAAAVPPSRQRELMMAGMILGGVTVVFVGLTVLSRYLPALSVQAEKVPFLLIAPLAGAIAWFLIRGADIHSPALKHGVPIAVGLLVYTCGFLVSAQHAEAARQDQLWTSLVDPVAGAPGAAIDPDKATARKLYAQTLSMYEQQGNRQGQADMLRTSAELEVSLNQVDRALEMYARSYAIYRELGGLAAAADVSSRMGDLLRANNRMTPSRERYADAAALYAKLDSPTARVRSLQRLGDAEASLGRFDDARDSYLLALAQAQTVGDAPGRIDLLLRVGRVETRAARPERAREAFTRALKLAQERRDDAANQSRALLAIAQLESSVGNSEAAGTAFEQAVELADAARDPRLEARAWRWRGDAQRAAQHLDVARQHYTMALQVAQQGKQRREEARILLRLAGLDAEERNAESARPRYTQAMQIYQQLGRPVGQGHAVLGVGDLEVLLAQPAQANQAYNQALALYEKAEYAEGQIAALERLGRLNADSNPQGAQAYQARAAGLRRQAAAPAAAPSS